MPTSPRVPVPSSHNGSFNSRATPDSAQPTIKMVGPLFLWSAAASAMSVFFAHVDVDAGNAPDIYAGQGRRRWNPRRCALRHHGHRSTGRSFVLLGSGLRRIAGRRGLAFDSDDSLSVAGLCRIAGRSGCTAFFSRWLLCLRLQYRGRSLVRSPAPGLRRIAGPSGLAFDSMAVTTADTKL